MAWTFYAVPLAWAALAICLYLARRLLEQALDGLVFRRRRLLRNVAPPAGQETLTRLELDETTNTDALPAAGQGHLS